MDVADEVLERVRESLQIGERGLARRPGGFTWWVGRLAHHVDVGAAFLSGDEQLVPVSSRVPTLHASGNDSVVESVIGRTNLLSIGSSYVYDQGLGQVFLQQRGVVRGAEPGWRPRWLAMHFALQMHHALTQCDWMAKQVGGEVAADRPPGKRTRRKAPEILTAVRGQVFHIGRSVGRCASDFELKAIRDVAERYGASSATVETTGGVTIELPFGDGTARLRLSDRERHPHFGAGLAVWAYLPDTDSLEGVARLANWLNLRMSRETIWHTQQGSWGVRPRSWESDDGTCVATYCRFIPRALCGPGLALEAAVDVIQKVRRADMLLNPRTTLTVPDKAVGSWRWLPEDAGRLHA